jgi:hypothetical protein
MVYTGFRPAWIMYKRTDTTADWFIHDTKRGTYNLVDDYLEANTSNAEATASTNATDILSNGFKLRGSGGSLNTGTIVYLAFAENPFKYTNAR